MDQILRIRIEGPPLESWDPTRAVRLWWTNKTRRVDSGGHSAPRKRKDKPQSEEELFDWNLSDWVNWLESDSDTNKEADSDLSS